MFLTRGLQARIDYEQDGTILVRLEGHEPRRFERAVTAMRAVIPTAAREWRPDLGLWVIDAGWDEELQEALEDHFERADILVRGRPLDPSDAWEEEADDAAWPLIRPSGRHGWIDLDAPPPPRPRLGRLILPYWGDRD
jgi:hypothetical protein